jgi:hypothetical protein
MDIHSILVVDPSMSLPSKALGVAVVADMAITRNPILAIVLAMVPVHQATLEAMAMETVSSFLLPLLILPHRIDMPYSLLSLDLSQDLLLCITITIHREMKGQEWVSMRTRAILATIMQRMQSMSVVVEEEEEEVVVVVVVEEVAEVVSITTLVILLLVTST